MFCTQYRLFCAVCNKSYIVSKYSNHFRSQGHIFIVLKKRCCIIFMRSRTIFKKCYNNLDITCCISKLCLYSFPESNANTQTDISEKRDCSRKQDSPSEPNTFDEENIDPNSLVENLRGIWENPFKKNFDDVVYVVNR